MVSAILFHPNYHRTLRFAGLDRSWLAAVGIVLLLVTQTSQGQSETLSQAKAAGEPQATAPGGSYGSMMRIVKLLWKTQAQKGAETLEKAISQALARQEVASLLPELQSWTERFNETLADKDDPRRFASMAALGLMGQERALELIEKRLQSVTATNAGSVNAQAIVRSELLLKVWLYAERDEVLAYLESHLSDEILAKHKGHPWLEIIARQALHSDGERFSTRLIEQWDDLPRQVQVAIIEPLTQQPLTMRRLVAAVAANRINKELLNTNQLRKWAGGKDPMLTEQIESIWGKLRTEDDAHRKEVVAQTMRVLRRGSPGDPAAGAQVFKRVCAACHKLHGEGFEVGPDITGNGRGSFEQLVSNVMDPSLVIGKAFQARTVLTTDGRVLAGLVVAEDPKRITLKIQGGTLVELDREEDIEEMKESSKSLMPEGLEQQLSERETLDLFAYLCLAKPLDAGENDVIPGTPGSLHAAQP